MAEATRGLAAAGVAPGKDLDVIAHCNYPWPPSVSLPVTWLGFDVKEIVAKCVELIDRVRQQVTVPSHTDVPAKFVVA